MSIYSPGTCYVKQSGFELTEICICLPSADYRHGLPRPATQKVIFKKDLFHLYECFACLHMFRD